MMTTDGKQISDRKKVAVVHTKVTDSHFPGNIEENY
jgi:hypothetical protein